MAKSGKVAGQARVVLSLDDNIAKGLRNAQKKFKAFGASIGKIGTALSIAGAAITGPLLASAKVFSDVGDQLDKMASRTGFSVEALSELSYAAETSGTNIEDIEKSIRKFQKALGESGAVSETTKDSLDSLGLTLSELNKLSPEDQFEKIVAGLNKISDPTKKAAVAMELFGKSGTMLLPMLGDMEALRQEARDLGIVMSTEDAKAAAELNDAYGRVQRTFRALMEVIGSAISGPLTELANTIAKSIKPIKEWIAQNKGMIVSVLKVGAIISGAGIAFIVLGKVITGIGVAFGVAATAVTVLGAVLGVILSPFVLITAAVISAGIAILEFTGKSDAALSYLGEITDWLGKKFDALTADVRRAMGLIVKAIAQGNLGVAAKVAWESIKLEFAKGEDALAGIWDDISFYAFSTWDNIVMSAQKAWAKIAMLGKLAAIELKATWDTLETSIVDADIAIWEKLLGSENKFVQGMKRLNDREKEKYKAQKQPALDAERQKIYDDYMNDSAKATADRDQKEDDLAQAHISKVEEREKALKEANDAFNQALAEAKNALEQTPDSDKVPGKPKMPEFEDTISALEGKLSSMGTFSSMNISQMFGVGGSTFDRIAKATEQTAKNTAKPGSVPAWQ
jgi:hypothetical protein